MTRLTKIPMIAAFSAVIAAFGITTEASADRGDGRQYQRGDNYRGGGNHYRGNREVNRSHNREYRGNRDAGRSVNREYRGNRNYSNANREYRGSRHYSSAQRDYRGNRNYSSVNREYHGNRHHYRGNDRRWSDNRYRGNDHWRGDRRHYSGRHYGHNRHYAHGRYDYRRHWNDRNYYWNNRHHWSSWRPYYGPIWGGYRHAYWRDRGCVPVTRYWTWHGRPALVGGIQCYNPYGVAYIVDNDYYPLNYY